MADVKSKNLYELLGNTSDQDSDREPDPPTKIADKPVGRSGKRDAPKEAPSESRGGRGGRGGRRGGFTGSEQAFRDQEVGSVTNRGKPVDDGLRQDRHSDRLGGGRQNTAHDGYGRGGRGGRGYRGTGGRRGNAAFGDRQNRSGRGDHNKQADQSWGAPTGDGEWQTEREGQADATKEEKEAGWDTAAAPPTDNWDAAAAQGAPGWDESTAAGAPNWTEDGAPAVDDTAAITEEKEAEPEDKSVSYAEYLASQATKKMENLGIKEARKPNEGQRTDKKWAGAKALSREDEDYMGGEENKSGRRRERKTKEFITIDQSFKPEPRGGGGNRDRGRGRGDRGDRGDRSDRGDRPRGGRGEGRGGFRGSRGDGEYRGGRGRGRGRGFGEGGGQVNLDDQSSFPSLGAK